MKHSKLRWIAYGLCGLLLVGGTVMTRPKEFDEKALDDYRDAIALEDSIDTGFRGFSMQEIPIRFQEEKHDYVYKEGVLTKEKPWIDSIAATAVDVDGEWQIILPTPDRFQSLVGLAGAVSGDLSAELSREEYIAMIWHEGFHAWQLGDHPAMQRMMEGGADQAEMLKALDGETAKKEWMSAYVRHLEQAMLDTAALTALRQHLEEATTVFSEDELWTLRAMETAEGSARYVENLVLSAQGGEVSEEFYDGKGSEKLYRTGAALCHLLDGIDPEWKASYRFEHSLQETLMSMEE